MVFLDTLGYRQAATAQEGPGALEYVGKGSRPSFPSIALQVGSLHVGSLYGGDGGG